VSARCRTCAHGSRAPTSRASTPSDIRGQMDSWRRPGTAIGTLGFSSEAVHEAFNTLAITNNAKRHTTTPTPPDHCFSHRRTPRPADLQNSSQHDQSSTLTHQTTSKPEKPSPTLCALTHNSAMYPTSDAPLHRRRRRLRSTDADPRVVTTTRAVGRRNTRLAESWAPPTLRCHRRGSVSDCLHARPTNRSSARKSW